MRSLIRKRDLQDRRMHFRKSSGTIGSFSASIGERSNTENILSPVYIGIKQLLRQFCLYHLHRFNRSLDVCLIAATCWTDFYYLAKRCFHENVRRKAYRDGSY